MENCWQGKRKISVKYCWLCLGAQCFCWYISITFFLISNNLGQDFISAKGIVSKFSSQFPFSDWNYFLKQSSQIILHFCSEIKIPQALLLSSLAFGLPLLHFNLQSWVWRRLREQDPNKYGWRALVLILPPVTITTFNFCTLILELTSHQVSHILLVNTGLLVHPALNGGEIPQGCGP